MTRSAGQGRGERERRRDEQASAENVHQRATCASVLHDKLETQVDRKHV